MEPLILWCTPYTTGGVTAFAANLQMVTGWPMVRLAARSMAPAKTLPGWSVQYHMRSLESLIEDPRPMVLAGGSWKWAAPVWEQLAKRSAGLWWVFHDPTELKSMPHVECVDPKRCIILRESNAAHQPDATLLPQPYVPYCETTSFDRTVLAVSTARIDSIKQSHWIVEANRQLPRGRRVVMSGTPNRMYVYGKQKKYPELLDVAQRPPGWGSGAELCKNAVYSVDMSKIASDGGGLQYTTLEAIDAGAVPVVYSGWMMFPGPMHDLEVFVVDSPTDLAKFLKEPVPVGVSRMRELNRRYLLRKHAPYILKAAYSSVVK